MDLRILLLLLFTTSYSGDLISPFHSYYPVSQSHSRCFILLHLMVCHLPHSVTPLSRRLSHCCLMGCLIYILFVVFSLVLGYSWYCLNRFICLLFYHCAQVRHAYLSQQKMRRYPHFCFLVVAASDPSSGRSSACSLLGNCSFVAFLADYHCSFLKLPYQQVNLSGHLRIGSDQFDYCLVLDACQ